MSEGVDDLTTIFGVDIGGSGIRGAPVDVFSGAFTARRREYPTPQLATPASVAETLRGLTRHFGWEGLIGCAFPAVVRAGVAHTASNVDESWIGMNARDLFSKASGCALTVLNDADAAGMAEMELGAGRDESGVVMVLIFGTGIGSALFADGKLLANVEIGRVDFGGEAAELRAAARCRTDEALNWEAWARRVQLFLDYLDMLFFPDVFITGRAIIRDHARFLPLLRTRARLTPARFFNDAVIIGAALAANAHGAAK